MTGANDSHWHGHDLADPGTVVTVTVLSDTHLPTRSKDLPAALWADVERADLVVHAGDWVSADLLDALTARSRRLLGVAGNNDGPELHDRLPEVARATVGGVRIAVVHETGQKAGRERRAEVAFPDTDLLIFGHSHIPWDTVGPGGMRLINPGSPTDRRRQPTGTWLTLTLSGGSVQDLQWHHVPPVSR